MGSAQGGPKACLGPRGRTVARQGPGHQAASDAAEAHEACGGTEGPFEKCPKGLYTHIYMCVYMYYVYVLAFAFVFTYMYMYVPSHTYVYVCVYIYIALSLSTYIQKPKMLPISCSAVLRYVILSLQELLTVMLQLRSPLQYTPQNKHGT